MISSLFSVPMTPTFPGALALGLGPPELLIIGALVLLLFGSRKLPALARSMGSSITEFKKGLKETDAIASESVEKDSDSSEKDSKDGGE